MSKFAAAANHHYPAEKRTWDESAAPSVFSVPTAEFGCCPGWQQRQYGRAKTTDQICIPKRWWAKLDRRSARAYNRIEFPTARTLPENGMADGLCRRNGLVPVPIGRPLLVTTTRGQTRDNQLTGLANVHTSSALERASWLC